MTAPRQVFFVVIAGGEEVHRGQDEFDATKVAENYAGDLYRHEEDEAGTPLVHFFIRSYEDYDFFDDYEPDPDQPIGPPTTLAEPDKPAVDEARPMDAAPTTTGKDET